MAETNLIKSKLPRIFPTDSELVRVDETFEFFVLEYDDDTTSTKTVYTLDLAPFERVRSVEAVVDGVQQELSKGTDYAVVDEDGDGEIDSLDFGIGGDNPDANTDVTVSYVAEPLIRRYVTAYDDRIIETNDKLDIVIDSHHVDNATKDQLDQIGFLFGEIGKRRGRDDDEYRALLKTIASSFRGQGTVPGLKFAVAAGVGIDPEDVTVNEDFTQVGYTLAIENVDTNVLSSVINDLANLADPSGVELLEPPVILLAGDEIIFSESGTTEVESTTGLGGSQLNNGTLQ